MILLLIATAWLASGAMGSYLALEFFWRRGSFPLDVSVGDMIFFGSHAIAGPINLLVGIMHLVGWMIRSTVDTERVVMRRHLH